MASKHRGFSLIPVGYPGRTRRGCALDYFERARVTAAGLMLLAGALAILGSILDWVRITPPEVLPTGRDFQGRPFGEVGASKPFSGIDATDGWYVVAAGIVLILAAVLLVIRAKAGFAWLGLLATTVIGGLAISAYRGITDPTSSLSHRMELVGEADPALGLTFVTASAIAGLVGCVVGIAASPQLQEDE